MNRLGVGDEAPDFDLTSTEDVLLMLRDEISRTPALLYFIGDLESERTRSDLVALAAAQPRLGERHAKVLAIGRAKLAELKRLQRELGLRFPLLRDDRDFARRYGVDAGPEGEAGGPALFLVGSRQEILWLQNPARPVAEALPEILARLASGPSPSANYPRSVINRLVDGWVN